MDFIHDCYKSVMRMYVNGVLVEVPGQWFLCPPDAEYIPYFHPFLSTTWHKEEDFDYGFVGEIPSSRDFRGVENIVLPRYTGKGFCGSRETWERGGTIDPGGVLQLDEDGIPVCCPVTPAEMHGIAFGGGGILATGREGALRYRGGGVLLAGRGPISGSDGGMGYGGSGVLPIIGEGSYAFGGSGSLPLIGDGSYAFGGSGSLPLIGDGSYALDGSGLLPLIGDGVIALGGSGSLLAGSSGLPAGSSSGAMGFGGSGYLLPGSSGLPAGSSSGAMGMGGSGVLLGGSGGGVTGTGDGAMGYGGSGLLLWGAGSSITEDFAYGGTGDLGAVYMSLATALYDFDRNEGANAVGNGSNTVLNGANGGSGAIAVGITGTYMVAKLVTGAISAAGLGYLQQNDNTLTALYSLQANTSNAVEFRCYIPTLSTAAQRFKVQLGFMDNIGGTPTEGVWFEYSDSVNGGNWTLNTKKTTGGAGNTSSNAASGPAANTIVTLKIIVTGSSAEFFVNGVSVGTIATNVPTAATGIVAIIVKSIGTTSRELSVDYYRPTITF